MTRIPVVVDPQTLRYVRANAGYTPLVPDDIATLKAMVLASQAELRNRDLLIEKLKRKPPA